MKIKRMWKNTITRERYPGAASECERGRGRESERVRRGKLTHLELASEGVQIQRAKARMQETREHRKRVERGLGSRHWPNLKISRAWRGVRRASLTAA